MDKKRREWL